MGELAGNKAVESAASEWVMALERTAGRNPRDARYERVSLGYPADRPLTPIKSPKRRPFSEVVHRGHW
jgi:hypothetical protein